jgi:hypothetical protein
MSTSGCCQETPTRAPSFDVDRCTKAFASVDEARDFMLAKDYDGHVLLRGDGTYTAVCPTYPDGFYPDATIVATIGTSEGDHVPSED